MYIFTKYKLCLFLAFKKQYINYAIIKKSPKYQKSYNGTPLQYSCLENPMDGGAW